MSIASTSQSWEKNIQYYEAIIWKRGLKKSEVSFLEDTQARIDSDLGKASNFKEFYHLKSLKRRIQKLIQQINIWHNIPKITLSKYRFKWHPYENVPKASRSLDHSDRVCEIQNYLAKANLDPQIEAMLTKLMISKAGAEFLYKALNSHPSEPLKVKIQPSEKVPFGGFFHASSNTIFISGETENERFTNLIFELSNLIQIKKFHLLDKKTEKGKVKDALEYALANEKIEYQGWNICSELIKTCIATDHWDPSLASFFPPWKDFEECKQTQLELNHTQHYMDWFNKNYFRK